MRLDVAGGRPAIARSRYPAPAEAPRRRTSIRNRTHARGFLPILRQPSSVRQLRSAIGTSSFSSLSGGRHLLRNRPELGAEVRTDDLATTTAARSRPSNRWHPDEMMVRIRRRGNVSPACCRPRGRSPRRAGSAPPRRPGRLTVDTKAGQELGFAPKL